MGEFKIPPLSTLIGSTLPNYFRVVRSGRVESKYYHKVFLTFLVGIVSNAFIPWERLRERYRKVEVKKPVFILGHWRSGTTLLHNILCHDPQASFITTYQSIFPHNMYSKWLFKNFLHWKIPDKRPTDDVDLGANLPQEDDFALSNITTAFYDFFFFPDAYKEHYERHIRFSENGQHYKKEWLDSYHYLIRKGLINRKGKYPVLKNPANTGRIGAILEQYPDARFIHIHRNPVTVYLSTRTFFLSLFPAVQLQSSSKEQIIDIIIHYYKWLMQDYLEQKELIPKENLYEIRFEDFELEPFATLEKVYQQFGIDDWETGYAAMLDYYKGLHGYKKSVYRINRSELDRVKTEWDFAFKALSYDIPQNLEVLED